MIAATDRNTMTTDTRGPPTECLASTGHAKRRLPVVSAPRHREADVYRAIPYIVTPQLPLSYCQYFGSPPQAPQGESESLPLTGDTPRCCYVRHSLVRSRAALG